MSNILVISPHLDDAVLSCGASIAQWASEGHTVFVATVFNHPDVHAGDEMNQHYLQRISDDEKALQSLGAKAIYLNFLDAPFRSKQYHNFNTILFHQTLTPEAATVAEKLAPVLKMVAEDVAANEIYFPLGIGGHIDHMIVFESSKISWNDAMPVSYYEELPYALVQGWSEVRLHQHNKSSSTTNVGLRLQDQPFAFLRNYMTDDDDLKISEEKYTGQLKALQDQSRLADKRHLEEREFTKHVQNLTLASFEKKCKAIQYYTSEWPVLFGNTPETIRQTLSIALNGNVYTENYWTLK